MPGCSAALVDAHARLWVQGFGLADPASGRAATPDTVYQLIAGTKLFTAVAVLQPLGSGLDFELSDAMRGCAAIGDVD